MQNIIITTDGVEITDGSAIIFICDHNFKTGSINSLDCRTNSKFLKYFSTEAARDKYILYNKPITVTLNEIIESPFLTVEFFKSKINQ